MTRFLLALTVVALSTLALPAQRSTPFPPDLQKISIEFAAAFNEKNAQKLATFYADDATLMPPGAPTVKGPAAIQAAFQQQIDAGVHGLTLTAVDIKVSGDHAFEAGTSAMTIGTGPKALAGRGKYLVVYRRVGSAWKIVHDIFNDDGPPAPRAQ